MDHYSKNSRENKRIKNKNKTFVYSSKHVRSSLDRQLNNTCQTECENKKANKNKRNKYTK